MRTLPGFYAAHLGMRAPRSVGLAWCLTLRIECGIIPCIGVEGNEYVPAGFSASSGWCEPNEAKARKIFLEPLTERQRAMRSFGTPTCRKRCIPRDLRLPSRLSRGRCPLSPARLYASKWRVQPAEWPDIGRAIRVVPREPQPLVPLWTGGFVLGRAPFRPSFPHVFSGNPVVESASIVNVEAGCPITAFGHDLLLAKFASDRGSNDTTSVPNRRLL
jgi:hypothetical protein